MEKKLDIASLNQQRVREENHRNRQKSHVKRKRCTMELKSSKYERPSSSEIAQTQKSLIYELPAPFVTSSHWCIVDRKKNELLFGRRE
jgi:hypothetical protein